MRLWPGFAALLLAAGLLPVPAAAQDYPRKQPIRLIVAQGAGSATDIMGRVLAERMGEVLGQRIIVDNRPGAGGLVGTELAAKSKPDGYTLFLASVSSHGVNPGLYKQLPYDPVADFTPIGMTGLTGNVLIVNAALPFRTLGDLIAAAKAAPDTILFATPGNGSSQHLATELFNAMAGGLRMKHVPYKGTAPGLQAVMGGEVAWMMPAIPSGQSALKSGLARPLAVTTKDRVKEMPDVPAIAETLAGFEVVTWYGLVGPAGLAKPTVTLLNEAIGKALAHPEALRALHNAGLEPETSTPEKFADFIKAEIAKWSKVANDADIKLD